ncbi:MAG: hypothetical protein IPK52_27620 [Chloroflexi bacterium]|nr:hypothetical protein [Chloroflexota bacterium]
MTAARAAHEEEKAEIIRLRDGEIERVRGRPRKPGAMPQKRRPLTDRINGNCTGINRRLLSPSTGGIIPFNGTSNTPLPNLGGALGSGVNVVIQSLNLGEIATPGGVSSAIMNLTQLFAQAFQQLRVGA